MTGRDVARVARRVLFTNVPYKVLSVLIALALWFIVRDERIEDTLTVELEVQPAAELVITNEQVPDLTVAVAGTRASLLRLKSRSLVHGVKPRATEPGPVTLRVRPEDLELPAGVEALSVSPATISLRLETRTVRRVPVRPRIVSNELEGWRVKKVVVEPARVRIAGPTSVVAGLDEVWTLPIDVTPRADEPVTGEYTLSLPHRQLRLEDPGPVRVRIEFEVVTTPPPSSEPTPSPNGKKGARSPRARVPRARLCRSRDVTRA